ncbi:plasmid SOS inhibition protein A [Escherichia coli]|uniref:plasmid SOS inhibition protein A n=1 Tax=Escherichia coli TaxID=562 RepID=UPI00345BBF01
MSRFVLGNCIDVMARIPDNAIDFILTDPPYLVGFRDRSGRTIAGDKTDEWLQPACNEMFRVLKKDALMVSFYGWNRVDRFMAAWKNAGFPSVPFREGERRRQKTTLTEQKYSRQREREAERRELEYQTCFAQAQIDLAFHTPATVGSWLSRWSGVVEEHDLETIFWGWCGRFPSLSSFDRFFWQEEPLWRLIFEAGEAGRGAPVQVRALEQWMIPNKLENAI